VLTATGRRPVLGFSRQGAPLFDASATAAALPKLAALTRTPPPLPRTREQRALRKSKPQRRERNARAERADHRRDKLVWLGGGRAAPHLRSSCAVKIQSIARM
jgi:hypothetical protein